MCCLLVKGAENDGFKIEVDVLFPYVQKMVTNNSQGHFCYDTFFQAMNTVVGKASTGVVCLKKQK